MWLWQARRQALPKLNIWNLQKFFEGLKVWKYTKVFLKATNCWDLLSRPDPATTPSQKVKVDVAEVGGNCGWGVFWLWRFFRNMVRVVHAFKPTRSPQATTDQDLDALPESFRFSSSSLSRSHIERERNLGHIKFPRENIVEIRAVSCPTRLSQSLSPKISWFQTPVHRANNVAEPSSLF